MRLQHLALLPLGVSLRRLMCNELDQQACQMAQLPAERLIDPLCAGECRNHGGEACQHPAQGLGSVALQAEEVLELADHPLDDLPLASGPPAIGQVHQYSSFTPATLSISQHSYIVKFSSSEKNGE